LVLNFKQAYQALDFTGKGYVDVNDFVNLKIFYRLPISKDVSRFYFIC